MSETTTGAELDVDDLTRRIGAAGAHVAVSALSACAPAKGDPTKLWAILYGYGEAVHDWTRLDRTTIRVALAEVKVALGLPAID